MTSNIINYFYDNDQMNIQKLLDKNSDLSKIREPKTGRTLLSLYLYTHKNPDVNIVKQLLDCRINVNKADIDGVTPLMLAGSNCNALECLKILIENGANIYAYTKRWGNKTVLYFSRYCLESIKYLIKSGVKIDDICHLSKNSSILMKMFDNDVTDISDFPKEPSEEERENIVNFLIKNGANINKVDNDGHSPLFIAFNAEKPNTNIIKLFVKSGCKLKKSDYDDILYSLISSEYDNVELIDLLVKKFGVNVAEIYKTKSNECSHEGFCDNNVFTLICQHQRLTNPDINLKNIEYIIQNGIDVNHENKHGVNALNSAVSSGYIDMIKFLIKYGADPNIKNKYGVTPIFRINDKWRKNKDDPYDTYQKILNILIKSGAKINMQDTNGDTPFIYIAKHGDIKISKLLIDKGADINIRNNENETALMIASKKEYCKPDYFKFLIENGALDKDGNVIESCGEIKMVFSKKTGKPLRTRKPVPKHLLSRRRSSKERSLSRKLKLKSRKRRSKSESKLKKLKLKSKIKSKKLKLKSKVKSKKT